MSVENEASVDNENCSGYKANWRVEASFENSFGPQFALAIIKPNVVALARLHARREEKLCG